MPATLSAYDAVAYVSQPFSFTHPARIAALGVLFGLTPAPAAECRVLELGCAAGMNLAALAASLPASEFVGIDLSEQQIQTGQTAIRELGLTNIRLEHMDFRELGHSQGKFDYILCHGVYSWVTSDLQAAIRRICATLLSENGIAYISYNTLPGWYNRMMIRDMLLFHSEQFRDEEMFVPQARAMVALLQKALRNNNAPLSEYLKSSLAQIDGHPDWYLRHDILEEVNEPLYFHQFAASLEADGLQYLADSELSKMVDFGFPDDVRGALRRLGDDIIRYEQYLDFLRNRGFRRSLVCRTSQTLSRQDAWKRVDQLDVLSLLRRMGEPGADGVVRFESEEGGFIETNDPVLLSALDSLSAVAPQTLSFQELIAKSGLPPESLAREQEHLAKSLFQLTARGLVELTSGGFSFRTDVTETPRASNFIRFQAASGDEVTNLRHELLTLLPEESVVLKLLDGTRTASALAQETGQSPGIINVALARFALGALLEG